MEINNDPLARLEAAKERLKAKQAQQQASPSPTLSAEPENPLAKYYNPKAKAQPSGGSMIPLVTPQAANPMPEKTAQPKFAKPDKGFFENIKDGWNAGLPSMLGNVAQGVAEFTDMIPSITSTAPAMGMPTPSTGFDKFAPAYKKELENQAKGESKAALPSFRDFAKEKYAEADIVNSKADPESWGYMIGSLAPQTAGIATAVGVGAFNPAAGMVLGMANTGALGAMAAGGAAKEYDDYVAEKGIEVNPNDKLGSMMLSMAAESVSEAIPVAKFIPKGYRGKMAKFIFGNTEVATKKGAALLEEFAKSNASRGQMVKNLLREAGEGALTEGPTEAVAELGGEFSTWLYKEKEDRATFLEMAERAGKAVVGGSIMGGAIGPLSYGAQQVQNQRRRKESGKVVLAQDKTTGEALEIMGVANPSKKEEGTSVGPAMYQAIRPNGKVIEIDENNVGTILELPLEDFNGLLSGKGKALQEQQLQKASEANNQAQAASNEARAQFEPMTYQGPDGTPMISGAKYNGEDVFITQLFPDGTAVIQKPGADKQVVKQDGLTEMDTRSFEDFISTFAPPPAQTAPSVSLEPVQIGEEINMGDAKYLVTGFDEESGIVQLENNEDASDLPSLPIDQFNEFRQVAKAQQPVLAGDQAGIQEDPTEESPAEQLRKLFAEGETVDLGGKTEIEEAKSLPKATEQTAKQYEDIKTLVDKKLGVKFNFATVGLQKELRLNDMKEALKQAGEIGQELADIIDFPSAALRFLNNLPDATPTRAINPQSPDLPAQQNQPDLGGAQPAITPDAPKEPLGEGIDNQVQVGEPVNNPNKLEDDGITLEQQFELNPAKNTQDIDNNINEVLSQYSGKTMGKVQVFRYLTELGELGKQWAKEKGISSKEDLDKWAEKAQNKARAGKGKERKETKKLIDQQKAEFNVSEIEKMALQAENDFLNQPQSVTDDTPSEANQESKLRIEAKNEFDKISGVKTSIVGSTARGEAKQDSDIDIILEGMPIQGKEKLNEDERSQNSEYAYDTLVELAKQGIITEFELLRNGFGLSFKFNGYKFQVVPNPTPQKGKPIINQPKTNEAQQLKQTGQAGQEDVQAEQNQKDRPEEVQGQEELLQGGVTPSQYEDVEKASTAEELAELYDAEVQNMEGVHPIDAAIADHIGKINPESFARFGDRNNISKGLAANWIAKKGTGKKVDLIAKDASEQFTPGNSENISTQDVIDFINKYNNISEVTTPKGNPKLKAINDKHIALTGKGLNRATALAKAKELRKQIQALQKKSVNKADDGKLLETDEQIAEYLANNPDILDFLQVSFGKPGESIWESGEINWKAALNMLETNPGFFTSFPGSFTALELDKIRTILNSKINEQAASNTTADSTVQADPKPEKPTGDAANQPNQAKQADQASPRANVGRTGQKPNPANPDNAGEAIPGRDPGIGSNPSERDVKLSSEAQKKADELKNLFGDFFDAGKDKLQSGPINAEQIVIAGKIIGKASELGIVRFKQLIEWANQNLGSDKMRRYFDSFKAAFGANLMINNPEGENINEIAASKFDDYLVVEKPKKEAKSATINGTKGDINKDGYFAYNSNYSSKQDAVYADENLFIVADGMGSYSESGQLAKDLVEAIAGLKEKTPAEIKRVASEVAKKYTNAATTLSIVEKTGNPGEFRYYSIGDSPIYIFDKDGNVRERINESINVATNGILAFGKDKIFTNEQAIKTGKINLEEGETLVVASDGFGDVFARIKEPDQIQGILEGLLEGDEKFVQEIRDVFKDEKSDDFSVVVVKSDNTKENTQTEKPEEKKEFTYLLTQRPPSIGTHPEGTIKDAEEMAIRGRKVWKLTYAKPLTQDQIDKFELSNIYSKDDVGKKWSRPFGKGDTITLEITNVSEDGTIEYKEFTSAKELPVKETTFKGIDKILTEKGYNTTANQQDNVPNRPADSQPDREIPDAVQADPKPVSGGRADVRNDGEGNRQPGSKAEQPQDRPGSFGISTPVSGKSSNQPVQQQLGIFGTPSASTGVVDGRGDSLGNPTGNDAGRKGDVPVDKGTKDGIESFADSFKRKIKLQAEAEKIPAKLLDKENIRETLPVLLDEQQEDVIRAEERFFGEQHKKPELANGKGYLFTNGTGTGKTFTGLGVAKRFIKQGKVNILLVVPGQPKVADWKDAAEKLGITINPLANTKDAGKGFVATTYANFNLNQALKDRDWDLIIYDESHLLMAEQKGNESSRTVSHYKHSGVSERWALEKLKEATGLWAKERELRDQVRRIIISMNNPDRMDITLTEMRAEYQKLEAEADKLVEQQNQILPSLKERAKKNYENTKVLFLSASPFATVKNLAYANGTLFDWGNDTTYEQASRGKSRVDPKSRFFLDNFGAAFEWKFHQLQERSNANAEAISMQEIAFGNKLAEQGVQSGRAIESNRDYARHFPLVSGFNRDLYNDAINEIYKSKGKYATLSPLASKQFFEYENALQLMESMRTSMSLSRIDEHLKLGRKVVIFHKRHKADVSPPFANVVREAKLTAQAGLANPQISAEEKKKLAEMLNQAEAFEQDFAELLKYEQTLDYSSTVEQITKKYGDQALYFNGNVSTKDKIDAIKQFNDDDSKVKIIVVHEQSGREGISLHDTTGKNQRALMSMSLPSQSITTLQVEGRIYRIGQESDAVLEYPILGLDTEIAHFASKINKKVSTTENLAMGDGSRDLLKSFAFGVMNASDEAPNMEQGKGGKELDKREREEHSQFKKARLVYAGNQKVRGTRKDRQGVDFYPTPEPVGQKMVEWLGLTPTQKFLEPSAGKGAIAMWAPGSVKTTAIEPAMDLIGRLGSVIQNGETLQMDFMDHNIINKYDGVAMNPPFGQAGSDAIKHLEKATKHLRNGGRVVALIPVGATDKKFDAFMESKDASDLYLRAEILLPSVTFEKAGTAVNTRIVVIDKISKPKEEDATLNMTNKYIDLRGAKTVDELFDRLENISMPDKIELQVKEAPQEDAGIQEVEDILNTPLKKPAVIPSAKANEGDLKQDEFTHTKTGEKIPRVTMEKRFTTEEYQNLNKVAKANNGYWSPTAKGFLFKSKEGAEKFINSFGQVDPDSDIRFMKHGDQTSSKAFKDWFGDSKVVNPDGSPMVVYHGGTAKNEFSDAKFNSGSGDGGWLGRGFYFTSDLEYAESYVDNDSKKLIDAYVKAENPYIVQNQGYSIEDSYSKNPNKFNKELGVSNSTEAKKKLISLGYDSVILKEVDGEILEIVAFNPTQIKSATGNKGTFDGTNPDIRFSRPTTAKTFTAKNGKEYEIKSFPNMVVAFEKGDDKNIGTFTFMESDNALDGISIKVAPAHQRNGIGKELVKFAEKTYGKKYKPSSIQSGDFQKFYASINRPTTAAELNQFFSSNRAQEMIEAPKGPKQTKKAGEVAKKAAEFTKGWNNAPEIITLDSPEQALARFPELAANYTVEDLGDVPAIFLNDPQTGKPAAVLIASHSYLSEKGGVERAILHEVIGHYGLREFLKSEAKGDKAVYVKEFSDLMGQVFDAKADTSLMADIAQRYFNKPVSELQGNEKLIAADEYIAHLAQSGVQDSWIDRVVAKLRQILRKLGITVGMNDAEIRALIGNSMRIVRGEKGRPVLRQNAGQSEAMTMLQENMNAQVIDGFYSPIEQRILDFKQNKASATKWKEIVGKKDEAQWTGVFQYLDGLKPDQQVSKQELLDWMKDNRVRIEVVQKGKVPRKTDPNIAIWENWAKSNYPNSQLIEVNPVEFSATQIYYDVFVDGKREVQSGAQVEPFYLQPTDNTKFSQYQLEGDKTDYKEVLVTLPRQSFFVKEEEGKFYVVDGKTNQVYKEYPSRNLANDGAKAKNKLGDFKSSHFGEPNILVHLRMNTRTDADGSKVLFLEEIQSDWGQKGKKEGFSQKSITLTEENTTVELSSSGKAYRLMHNGLQYSDITKETGDGMSKEQLHFELIYLANKYGKNEEQRKSPLAPFVTDTNSWVKLGLKVAMQEAVAQGADRIAWTTGTQQNERYDLSKVVKKITYKKDGFAASDNSQMYSVEAYYKNGDSSLGEYRADELESVVGKEIADKIIKGESTKYYPNIDQSEISGLDLKIGGTGMKAFYGDPSTGDIGIVGRVAESLVGKGSVGEIIFSKTEKSKEFKTREEAIVYAFNNLPQDQYEYDIVKKEDQFIVEYAKISDDYSQTQHSIPVTPALIDQVQSGLPMFMRRATDQTQSPAFKSWFGDSKVVDENGKPLVVYHGTQAEFTAFDGGAFFTDDYMNADGYAGGENVIETFIKIERPLIINARGRKWDNIGSKFGNSTLDVISSLDTEKYDGIIFQNIKDSWTDDVDYQDSGTVYYVSNPTQIKSATSNNGDFNPDNADIRFMRTGATNADFSAVNTKNYGNAQLSWFERRVIEPLQDRMIRSKKLIQARTDGKVSDKADFYTKENLASGKTLEKARRFEKDLWNPLIQTANQLFNANQISPEEISNYLKFKHHAERKAYFIAEYAKQGKKIPKDDKWPTGMTDQEAADGIADFEAKADPKLVKKLRRQVHKVNQFTTFQRYKSGMITKEVFKDLLTRYKNYVPLTDWKGMEDTNDKVYTLLMSAKGRTSEAADPLPFMFTAAQESIMRGENNRIRRSVLEFVKENVSPKDYFIRSAYYLNTKSQDEFGNDIWIETMNKPSAAQIQSGEAMRSFNPQIHRHVQQQGELTNVLPVMVDGKKVFIEFKDKEIPSAIKNINQDKLPYILDKWRNFTRWLSSMYTQYSPEFGVRNLIRDVGFGTFNILVEQDATTAAKTMKGMFRSSVALGKFFNNNEYPKGKTGQMLKEFMEEGSMTGYTDLQTAAEVFAKAKKEIEKADKLNLWQAGGNAISKPLQAAGKGLEVYNKTLENAMRFSYYQALREAGMSKQQAAAKAKDLTVNFNRKGRASSVMGSLFIFFNASVQGSERLIRSFTNPKTRQKALGYAGAIMAAGMMQSLLYGLSDEEDEDGRTFYEKIPDYTRRNNIILPNFFTEDGNDFLKIPLPYGLNVFHSFGESLGQVLTGKKTIGQESLGMVSAMTNVFSPIGGIELGKDDSNGFYDVLSMTLPSVIQPALDLGFNRNFAGRQIYRENFSSNQYQLPDSQMYFEGVNPIIREATDFANRITGGNEVVPGAIDINPEWIEHGINQYLGGPAQFTQNLSNTVINLSKGENVFKDPFLRSTPFVRSFVDKTGTDYQARSEYYENRDNAVSAAEAYDEMLQAGLKEDADQWYKEKQELINLADEFKSYEKDIRSLTKTINELKNEDNERYNDDIQKLLEERTLYMREFNKLYGERIYKKRSNPLKDLIRGN